MKYRIISLPVVAALLGGVSAASAQEAAPKSSEESAKPASDAVPEMAPQAAPPPPEEEGEPVLRVPPPRAFTTSRGGVDLQTGSYLYSHVDLSVGGPHMDGGINLVRDYSTTLLLDSEIPRAFGDFDHNLDIRLAITLVPVPLTTNPGQWDRRATVRIGAFARSFIRHV